MDITLGRVGISQRRYFIEVCSHITMVTTHRKNITISKLSIVTKVPMTVGQFPNPFSV
jgi:hypothetical protein